MARRWSRYPISVKPNFNARAVANDTAWRSLRSTVIYVSIFCGSNRRLNAIQGMRSNKNVSVMTRRTSHGAASLWKIQRTKSRHSRRGQKQKFLRDYPESKSLRPTGRYHYSFCIPLLCAIIDHFATHVAHYVLRNDVTDWILFAFSVK